MFYGSFYLCYYKNIGIMYTNNKYIMNKIRTKRTIQAVTYLDKKEEDELNDFISEKGLSKSTFIRVSIFEAIKKGVAV